MELAALSRAAQALADETRLRLLALLAEGERPVKELVEVVGQSQPRISRHLKILTEAGLIRRMPEGAHVYYRLARDGAAATLARAALDGLAESTGEPQLRRDHERLALIRSRNQEAAERYFAEHAEEWHRLRALHVPEGEVEEAILAALGKSRFRALLDIGTGSGRMLELLAGRAERLTGVDRSPQMLSLARAHMESAGLPRVQLRAGDALALPLPRGAYDLVVLHQVLHFLDDPAAAIAEATRVLAPGGTLLIVDFAPHHVEFLREEHAHRRLGFSDEQLTAWLAATELAAPKLSHLSPPSGSGEQLTVTICASLKAAAGREPGAVGGGSL
ncbi:metalloregulator ArsR/SmtB family transcription factor [Afifella sp. IM 167]|uniref:ArsR/SmtB family transcription factor n=1 Tax=Afifella sp. IM 167 TaxID=2033586 RepID=UPI001CCE7513|nr:metalloregulator ArsR/SmtB family transcription factor [Afifella sp. IM 167]